MAKYFEVRFLQKWGKGVFPERKKGINGVQELEDEVCPNFLKIDGFDPVPHW